MKNICVLVENISVDYTLEAVKGISDYFKDKDVCLSIYHVHRPDAHESTYNYQYWIGTLYAANESIDAVIIVSGCFCSFFTPEELAKTFSFIDSKKVVSMSIPLPGLSRTHTYTECTDTYTKIVKHLKEVHGCKKLFFISANPTGSVEALERFEAYKNALNANGFTYDPSMVVDGYFTYSSAYELMKQRYPDKNSVDFDAVIAANDMMAFGCIALMNEYGIRIPEDIKVVGYDDIYKSSHTTPTLSTVNQQISKQGYESAALAYKIAMGEEVPARQLIEIDPCYRQSCGCEPIEINDDGFNSNQINVKTREEVYTSAKFQTAINHFLDQMQNIETFDDFVSRMDVLLTNTSFMAVAVCLYEETINVPMGKKIKLPKRAYLAAVTEINKIKAQTTNITFNPRKQLIPEGTFVNTPGTYMFYPIFNGEKQYGYFFCKLENNTYFQHHIFLKVFAHTVCLSVDYSKSLRKNSLLSQKNEQLLKKNTSLNIQSVTDELTGILNRRGFLEMGQKSINFALKLNKTGVVFFSDMDGLKLINDNFGHEMGDKAIQAQAEILTRTFRSTDIIGRMSGDEFAAVVPGLSISQIEKIREKLISNSKLISREKQLPFEISISIGGIEFSNENMDILSLLKEADKLQYEEKKLHHKNRK